MCELRNRLKICIALYSLCATLLSEASETSNNKSVSNAQKTITLPTATDSLGGKNRDFQASLPPLPEGVTDLSFKDFFKMPIGPRGLEPTEKIQNLQNKRVRIVGFMAREDDPTPGIFLLAELPVMVAEKADGMADDLPAATLSVHMPQEDADKVLTYRPGPWVLTGRLQLGNQEESNDRISYARLIMDTDDLKATTQKADVVLTPAVKKTNHH